MIDPKLKKLITTAAAKDAEIERLKTELSLLEAQIKTAAENRDDLRRTDNGGKVWLVPNLIRITWPALALKKFEDTDPKNEIAKQIAGDHYPTLFQSIKVIAPVKACRVLAHALLDPPDARRLLKELGDPMPTKISYG